jgi:hypothetical protein
MQEEIDMQITIVTRLGMDKPNSIQKIYGRYCPTLAYWGKLEGGQI